MAIILFITPQEYDFCPLVFDMSRYSMNEIQKLIHEYEATMVVFFGIFSGYSTTS